jgi:hypothetical protein
LARGDWETAMRAVGEKMLGVCGSEWEPDAILTARVAELVRQKYSQKSYNEKR